MKINNKKKALIISLKLYKLNNNINLYVFNNIIIIDRD